MTNSKPPKDREEKEQEEWYERTRSQIILFAVGIALFGLALGLILDWYIDPQTSTQKKDLERISKPALGLGGSRARSPNEGNQRRIRSA